MIVSHPQVTPTRHRHGLPCYYFDGCPFAWTTLVTVMRYMGDDSVESTLSVLQSFTNNPQGLQRATVDEAGKPHFSFDTTKEADPNELIPWKLARDYVLRYGN